MEYLIATAKGIKGLRLTEDVELLDQIMAKFPEQLVERVPATVLSDDIEDKFKNSMISLHRSVKVAL